MDQYNSPAGVRPQKTQSKKQTTINMAPEAAAGVSGGVAANKSVNLGRSDRMHGLMSQDSIQNQKNGGKAV